MVYICIFTFTLCLAERCILSVCIRHNSDSLPSLCLYLYSYSLFHCAQWRDVFCLCVSSVTEPVFVTCVFLFVIVLVFVFVSIFTFSLCSVERCILSVCIRRNSTSPSHSAMLFSLSLAYVYNKV